MVFETLQSDPLTSDAAYYAWQWLPPMAFVAYSVYCECESRVLLSQWKTGMRHRCRASLHGFLWSGSLALD